MSHLLANSTPAERAVGCFFADRFYSAGDVVRNGGVINGAPAFAIRQGVTLDGVNDFIEYDLSERPFTGKAIVSFHVVFWPDFAFIDGTDHYLFDATASLEYAMHKTAADVLNIYLGGTVLAIGDVSAQWVLNGRNVFTLASTTGATDAWLNGVQVVTALATAWAPSVVTELDVGQRSTGADRWGGRVDDLRFFDSLLTLNDHLAVLNPGGG